MPSSGPTEAEQYRGILMRLLRDRRGNTIAIAAGALIPLIGFSGSAIDMARLYIVKVRLQQACDAGVLAGRRVMTDTSMRTPLDGDASKQAQAFFSNNFRPRYLNSTAVRFEPVKAATGDRTVGNAVTGTATATVPMTVMNYFNVQPMKINVACQAVFDLADSDVVFVLDTTGSMACPPVETRGCASNVVTERRDDGSTRRYLRESSDSRLEGLRRAVMLFDQTMRSNADASSRFRYGFVPYASSVNVGRLLVPRGLMQNGDTTYQSRRYIRDYNYGRPETLSRTGVPRELCVNQRLPETGFTRTGFTWGDEGFVQAKQYYDLSWSANNRTCSGKQQTLRPVWLYGPTTWSVRDWSAFRSTDNPTRFDGQPATWQGCIEEIETRPDSSFSVTNLPPDLDPDARGPWRPAWPDVEWQRNGPATEEIRDQDAGDDASYGAGSRLESVGATMCGMRAASLDTMSATQVSDYVHDPEFRPWGGTYHDFGMIWGARMLSPDGIFGSTTTARPGRPDPARNIVFMTDGTLSPGSDTYGLYGIERVDQRVGAGTDYNKQFRNHTARFRVVCDAAKRKGITIYVVALGTGITDDLTYCASPGQTFEAKSTPELTAAFRTIAQRVAMLRISQ